MENSKYSWFDRDRFERRCVQNELVWGRPLRLFDSLASTNDTALAAVLGSAKTGILWVAREQKAGRGRRGRSWLAAPGECLTLSTLLRHRGPMGPLAGLSLVVGLAVRDLVVGRLRAPGGQARPVSLKWPNDVYVGQRKIAGILIETRRAKDASLGLVIGLGLNSLNASFPPELPHATSLRIEGVGEEGCAFEELCADFLKALENRCSIFLSKGLGALLPEIVEHDFLRGKKLWVGNASGIACGIDEQGRLLILDETGTVIGVESGHVTLDPSAANTGA